MNWVVYTWNLQSTCKNALIDAVLSWVVYTWKILEKTERFYLYVGVEK